MVRRAASGKLGEFAKEIENDFLKGIIVGTNLTLKDKSELPETLPKFL